MKPYIIGFTLILSCLGCDTEYNITQIISPNHKIVLQSNPSGAKIYLKGASTNKFTPDSLINLENGNYEIKFELAGYYDTLFSVSVQNENRLVNNIEMWPINTGNLVISSAPPGAEIFLDNLFTNKTTPDTLKYIISGTHTVYLRKEFYPDTSFTTDILPRKNNSNFIILNEIPLLHISFAEYIYPILQFHCSVSGCHSGPNPARQIDLTSWAGVTADPIIVFPGEPDLSRLVWAIEGNKPPVKLMPPNEFGRPMILNEINAIKTWIAEGALDN